MRNIVEDSRFLGERDEMMHYFQDMFYKAEKTELVESPSGKYKLEIHHFNYAEGIRSYNYTKGIVKDSHDRVIDVIYRNFASFIFSWVLMKGMDFAGQKLYTSKKKDC